MFERFTDRARRVVVLAQEEARQLGHMYIGTEHILLGLTHETDGAAARALDEHGIELHAVHEKVEQIGARAETSPIGRRKLAARVGSVAARALESLGIGRREPTSPGFIPFSPNAKRVLEFSLREALELGHNYIGTQHILLGLIREGEGEGAAVRMLVELEADLPRLRHQVARLQDPDAPPQGR